MFRKNKENTKPKKEKKEKKSFFKKKDKLNMDLEDSVANLDKQVNGVKEKKLVSVMPFRIARAFIWVLIGILCFRGGVSVFKGNQSEALKKENEKILNNIEKQSSLETQAFSFAEEFAWDYFSRYPSDTQDFVRRITKYTTEQLANEMNNGTYSDVIYTSAFYFEKYS
ncbi:conjugal transfer protein, partial [Clostridium perfringens]|nr:conjugal transfer protein [Clostridium perfringens]MDZ5069829.1 conjugal transfer protein [Clostridium perfringens]MDZ5075889.1 conjugal transfer protein [Clostridium perfringens]